MAGGSNAEIGEYLLFPLNCFQLQLLSCASDALEDPLADEEHLCSLGSGASYPKNLCFEWLGF